MDFINLELIIYLHLRDKKTGETSLFAANHKDDAHHQTTKWNASHQTKIKALRNRKSMMKGGSS